MVIVVRLFGVGHCHVGHAGLGNILNFGTSDAVSLPAIHFVLAALVLHLRVVRSPVSLVASVRYEMIVADSTESKHRHIDSSSAEVTVKEDIDSARTLQHYNNMTSKKTTKVRDVEQQQPPPPRPTDIKDDDDDDEDDEAPLVARSKVSPLEMESSRRRRKKFLEQEDQGNSLVWWVIRSVLMTVAAFLPVLIGFLVFGRESRGHVGKNNVDVTWDFDNNDTDDPTITPPTTVDETTTLEIERGTLQVRMNEMGLSTHFLTEIYPWQLSPIYPLKIPL